MNNTTFPIDFPNLAIGPRIREEVLLFDVLGRVVLHEEVGKDWDAFFHIDGEITDVGGRCFAGGRFETVFPFKFALAPQIVTWPTVQDGPFNVPPVDGKNTDGYGFSKSNFIFGDAGSIVTVGPSIAKFTKMSDGSAQLWVTSVGVTTDGTDAFAGVRGMGAFNGSAFYGTAPDLSTYEGRAQLRAGFPVKVGINLKVIRKEVS